MARVFGVGVAVPADEDALVADEELFLGGELVSSSREGRGGGVGGWIRRRRSCILPW